MPRAVIFIDEADYGAVLVDHVVCRDFGRRIAEPLKRFGGSLHAGVVQHDHRYWKLSRVPVG